MLVRTRHSNLPAGLADGLEVGVLYRRYPDTPLGAGIAPLGPPRRCALGVPINLRLLSQTSSDGGLILNTAFRV